jgi:methylglutaconyl-CoA hydratase
MAPTVETKRDGLVAIVALNRPDSHNAFNPQMVAELTAAFRSLSADDAVRVVVLTGNGSSFCAGADLGAMRAAADYTFEQNVADGEAIFDLMVAVDSCPKPVIGRVKGAAMGGGAGLVSCCDIVVATEKSRFAFSEARLGIVPAVISPFVLAKIGAGPARELFLTGEVFYADRAQRIGLVHHVVADDELEARVTERCDLLLQAAPGAQAAAKELIRAALVRTREEMRAYATDLLARRRASDEGQDGMSAFLEKRPPYWLP